MKYGWYILLLLKCSGLLAQTAPNVNISLTMPSVALVDILSPGSTAVTLQMTAPTEAGNPIGTGSSNSANWLIFTSAVASGTSRSIKGELVGTFPPGASLRLTVAQYVGSGQGFTGGKSNPTGATYLTSTPTSFIDNIQGAYTGTGYGTSGFRLTYALEIQNFANIRSGTTNVTVLYTMVDN
jgi:hypothetical protein